VIGVVTSTLVEIMNRDFVAQYQREQLHRAARDGDKSAIHDLLAKRYPVNRFDGLGKTPLHYAVEAEHLDIVDTLLRAGAHVNAHVDPGDTPLGHSAASCSVEMAKKLIAAGADPTIHGWMILTAIDRARDRKKADGKAVLQLLLDAAASRRRGAH